MLPRSLDVERERVDEVDAVAAGGEPPGIDAGRAADVEDVCRSRRQEPLEELLRPQPLEVRTLEAVALDPLLVVRGDVRVERQPSLRSVYTFSPLNRRFSGSQGKKMTTFQVRLSPVAR